MPIDISDLAIRLRDSRAQCATIHANGLIRVVHRYGSVEFPSESALREWIATGQLPSGARTKFAEFDPSIS